MESKIQVLVRVKPLRDEEDINPKNHLWKVNDNVLINSESQEQYPFDKVYPDTSTTKELYQESVVKLIESTLEGMNATIFAYG